MILVDDNPFSYLYDNNNSIPILPFEGNLADKELLKLMKVLKNVFYCEDVREYIKSNFKEMIPRK